MAKSYIIAEIASAHDGKPDFALRLFQLAAATGADAVKFQIFDRQSLISRFHEKYEAFGIIALPPQKWLDVLAECGRSNVDVVVEVYDVPSLAVAEKSGVVKAYKIPTSDIGNTELLTLAARTGKQVMLAVGGATSKEIASAVDTLRPLTSPGNLVLMHGFQSFPTLIEDTNLERLRWLSRTYDLPVGYADHVDAEDREMARVIPAMAMAAGATVIEKHITDNRSRKGRDYYSSLSPDEFTDFVAFIRKAEIACGLADPALTQAEVTYRYLMKKQAVAAVDLTAGASLAATLIAYKRTGKDGISPADMQPLHGRKLKRAIKADEAITKEDFE